MREYVGDRDSSTPVMPLSVSRRWRPNQLIPDMTDVEPPDTSVTGLLRSVQRGDRDALGALFPLVYQELRVLARRQRRNWHGDATLNATALVHEAYIRLVDQNAMVPESRSHFFAVAAKAMRHILCDYARGRQRLKRGGGVEHVPISDELDALPIDVADEEAEQLAALDEALERLGQLNERQAQVVECRFFAGMNIEETAAALGLSPATVKRDWTMARAWLFREIQKR
jgi:RNA polymerase sigma factor (TIGR02999 family)